MMGIWKKNKYGKGVIGLLLSALLLSAGAADTAWASGGSWQKVPIVSAGNREEGSGGGEGCQWPQVIKCSESNPDMLFYGTNTGGIYRSVDGGKSWKLSMKGFYARGCEALAIDPKNEACLLAVGSSDKEKTYQGIYRSENRGESWKLVLSLPVVIGGLRPDCLIYDASSFRESGKRCMTAYYSTPGGLGQKAGLYCTVNGGKTWKLVNRQLYDAKLMINPQNGDLYAAREDGLYLVKGGGKEVMPLYEGRLSGCDISWSSGMVYLCGEKELLQGTLSDGTFSPLPGQDFLAEGHGKQIAVSPVNPKKLLLHVENDANAYIDDIYVSRDGGKHWQKAAYDGGRDFFPYLNPRDKIFAWSYTDENRVWSFGGDFVISSNDGGKSWRWDSAGICGVLVGGKFQFNLKNPDLLFLGFQDYNGALTTDGGRTWTYIDMSGKGYSGHVYGGYAASEKILWGCLADSWDSPRYITISSDGGATFRNTGKAVSELLLNGDISSCQSYRDEKVFFAGNYRSDDGGATWKEMQNCLQVYTCNPEGSHELYGCEKGKGYVLVSYDEGKSWERVNSEEIPIYRKGYLNEVQLDAKRGILYVAADGQRLYAIESDDGAVKELTGNLRKDQRGNICVNGIALDAEKDRIYVSGYDVSINRSVTVLYSDDSGRTWKDASSWGSLAGGDQVLSPMCLRLQPQTKEMWCSTSCYGMLKLTGNSSGA